VIAVLPLALLLSYPGPVPNVDAVSPDSAVDIVERLNEPVPRGLRFVDSSGRKVTFGQLLRGKPVILGLVYYRCPVLCNLLLGGLARALGALDWKLGRDYDVVTVSLDPSEPSSLAAEKRGGFLQALGQPDADGWSFLTGKVDDIDTLSDAVGMRYQYVAKQRQFAHAAALFVLTADGRVSRYLYGVEFPPKQLKLALFEAAGGRVGTSFERVLLRCYRYDPQSKRYELFITRYFRAGGVVLMLAVGGLLAGLWRRELRQKVRA
jgi:protein SCO1/2